MALEETEDDTSALEHVCHQCGSQSKNGEFGLEGTEHEGLWYCSSCWQAWENECGRDQSSQRGKKRDEQLSRARGYKGMMYHGQVYLPFIKADAVDKLRSTAELRPSDAVVCTFPRSGTTWVQTICLGLLLPGGPRAVKNPTRQSPWIEAALCRGNLSFEELQASDESEYNIKRRVFKTHATAALAPWKDRHGAKLIFVERDPRDVCVSLWHHMRNARAYHYDGEWKDFIELFLRGEVEGGDWWEFHRNWRRVCEELPPEETLWLRYEELKVDLPGQVRRIADFLEIEVDDERLGDVTHAATFEEMRSAMVKRNQVRQKNGVFANPHFIRRGEAGAWAEVMTDAESNRFLQRMHD